MNDSREETASLYVLDQLAPAERAKFEEQLALDPSLAALVRDYESAFAAGVRSLPPRQPSASLLHRIELEIDAETKSPANPASRRAQPARASVSSGAFWTLFAKWGLAAVIAVSLATLAIQSLRPSPTQPVFVVVGLDANRTTFAELPSSEAKDPDTRFIQLASAAEDLWRNPEARPLPAAAAAPADNRGYALFDPASQQGFIAIEQLPALPGNQQYHLWVVDEKSGRIRDAGILPLAGLNRGLYSFALDPVDGPVKERTRPNFFITVEDAAATPAPAKPSGKVVLGRESI